ncbi:sterile alpha motif domain-containing protein 3 [Triplophysa rosa]|uniref:sterile alpha motif domain-containing protein 3 n=1 Tax=Triplophysa rosa TaxID=992332 RepID=UPI00254639C1|nr:sterile alpha motif domain-containing protein 3 [Triplophysa rosa]XP_057190389.1 sterile alpha motif domain-containing protein 3 [Triplophysa rosa]
MSSPVILRIVFGGEDDARKLVLKKGIPMSVDDLVHDIITVFGLKQKFRLQYKDKDFGNEYVNLMSTSEIEDRDTLKLIFLSTEDSNSSMLETEPALPYCSTTPSPSAFSTATCDTADVRDVSPSSIDPAQEVNLSDDSVCSCADTVVVLSPESRTCSWPQVFVIPRFSCSAEIQLQRADAEFNKSGTLLIPPPKLRSDILEGMAEQIFRFTAYPTDSQLDQAAEALINAHPYLREKGTHTGHEGWKHYLKIKMANFRSKLSKIGHPEIAVNSLKNKRKGQGKAAANIKKPRKAEVNFLPCFPKGETAESMEKERIALLTEVKKKNNEAVIKEKMQLTFSYRRQELVEDMGMVSDLQSRWPALFTVNEINAEFMLITTVPLLSMFFGQLDRYTFNLHKVFNSK